MAVPLHTSPLAMGAQTAFQALLPVTQCTVARGGYGQETANQRLRDAKVVYKGDRAKNIPDIG